MLFIPLDYSSQWFLITASPFSFPLSTNGVGSGNMYNIPQVFSISPFNQVFFIMFSESTTIYLHSDDSIVQL